MVAEGKHNAEPAPLKRFEFADGEVALDTSVLEEERESRTKCHVRPERRALSANGCIEACLCR